MPAAPLPPDEEARLAALADYAILDTPAAERFDRITRIAAHIFDAPIALVSLVDRHRQWIKSSVGFEPSETPRDYAFCAHTILGPEDLVVADTRRDARFADNPLVCGAPHLRFYSGAPLITPDGFRLGTLCVIDFRPREDFDAAKAERLRDLAAMVVDELELMRQKRRAESSKDLLAVAIENISEALAFYDKDDRLVLFNSKYRELYAESADLIVEGARFEDIARIGAERGQYAQAIGNVEGWVAERMAHRRNPVGAFEQQLGDGRWLQIAERRTEDGGIVGIRTDITELKHRESELLETQVKLRASQEAAERANRAKSDFLAMMSHEVRTPMNGVLGTLGILADMDLPPNQRRLVDTARASGEALLTILNDILDFSKMEAGRLELEDLAFELPTLLEGVVSLYGVQARAKGLSLSFELSPGLPSCVRGDPGRLRQMLGNYVSNAIKFTESGEVRMRVAPADSAAGPDALRFSVTDTGIGIPPKRKGDVFRDFSQLDRSYARRFGGSGLGLAITRQLATMMGGRVGFDSEPGRGSVFWFEVPLPLVAEPDEACPQEAAETAEIPALGAGREPVRVLVVEDNLTNQMIARGFQEALGCRVDLAGNGLEAIEAVGRRHYDLVLMDISMPELDGVEATRRIRRLPPPVGTVRILALTANALREDEEAFLAAGMNGRITKPIVKAKLAAALAELPGRSQSPGDGAEDDGDDEVADAPLIDDAAVAELAEALGSAALTSLMDRLVADLEACLAAIETAIADRTLAELGRQSHVASGCCGSFGTRRLHVLADRVEAACLAGHGTAAFRLGRRLAPVGRETIAAVRAMQQGWVALI